MKQISLLVLALVITATAVGCDDDGTSAPNSTSGTVPPITTQQPNTTQPDVVAPSSAPDATVAASSTTSTTVVPAVAADVAYADTSEAQRLDLYEPSTGSAPYPLVVIVHGGGWTVGDKRGELASAGIPGFLQLGYAVASVNYRLADEAIFPAPLLDVKAAIRYLRAHSSELGLDADRFAIVGESAGAHLATLVGTTADRPEFDDPSLGNGDVSSAVQAVVDFYGPADLVTSDAHRTLNPPCPSDPDPSIAALLGASPAAAPELAAAASPVTYLHPDQDLPPFFIAHGDADCVVPYQQSVELHDAIEAVAPGRSLLAVVPGSGHYFDFDFASQSDALAAFLASTVGGEVPGP